MFKLDDSRLKKTNIKAPQKSNFKILLYMMYFSLGIILSGCWPFDDDDKTEGVTKEVIAVVAPSANFSISTSTGKAPLALTFTDSSTAGSASITQWQWDFGDGGSSSEQNPQYIYENSGSFDVTLTVTTQDGSHNKVLSAAISVIPADVAVTLTVVDVKGLPIEGATLSSEFYTIESQEIDEYQRHQVKFRPNENSGVVKIVKEGFIDGIVFFESIQAKHHKSVTLQTRGPKILANAFSGGQYISVDGAMVNLPAEALVDTNGVTIVDNVDLYITPLDISDAGEVNAFPGGFYGIPTDENEDEMLIISYGVVDITFYHNGEELQLKEGMTADIEVPLYATNHPTGDEIELGDEIPLWILNKTTGKWEQEGVGTVIANAVAPNGMSMQAQTSHFSTFNSDFFPGSPGGGGGLSSFSYQYGVCQITFSIIGGEVGKDMNYDLQIQVPGWGVINREWSLPYDGDTNTFPIARRVPMSYKISQNDLTAEANVSCAENEREKFVSVTLQETPPTFSQWLIDIEPIFTKAAVNDPFEILANNVIFGAKFSGTEIGDFTTLLVNHPLGLPTNQRFTATLGAEDITPMPISISLTNEFGNTEETTQVEYINSHSPIVGYFIINPTSDGFALNYAWHVEGADSIDIYYLGDDPASAGAIAFHINSPEISQSVLNSQLVGLEGFIRVDFNNQYGQSSSIGRLTEFVCTPESDLCAF